MNVPDKTTGGTYTGAEFTEFKNESQNAILASGQALSSTDTQLAKSQTIAAQTGHGYQDSGLADAYVLSRTGVLGQPISYVEDMRVTFVTANVNTTASTVNISTLGVKKILDPEENALVGGEIPANTRTEMIYSESADSSAGAFLLTPWNRSLLAFVPTGMVLINPDTVIPDGFLECGGASLLRTTYPSLFATLGVKYGNVDATHFNVPDYRGEFLRGWDNGAGNDPDAAGRTDRGDATTGDNVGTKQLDAMQEIQANFTGGRTISTTPDGATSFNAAYDDSRTQDGTSAAQGLTFNSSNSTTPNAAKTSASESRGRNINVQYIIKT